MKERKKNEQKERKPNWKEYTATVEEIQDFLMDHVPLRHNVITGRVEYRDGDMWQPITDRIVNSLWSELSQVKKVRIDDLHRVIGSDFVPDFHPFRYYLDGLPPWDGQNHILAMSVSVNVKGGVEEQMLFSEYLTKWLRRCGLQCRRDQGP